MTSLEKALRAFAEFAAKLKGDEKSEAQTFLFHLLEGFGHNPNTLPEGCTFEYRLRFAGGSLATNATAPMGGRGRMGIMSAGSLATNVPDRPLTPALSPSEGERENRRPAGDKSSARGSRGEPLPAADRTKFADLVWPGRCLIEMKSRGVKLSKHYQQTFDYWLNLVPHRPPYVVLCNFDELWIYDFNTQLQEPVDRLRIDELPTRHAALNFLFPRPFQ